MPTSPVEPQNLAAPVKPRGVVANSARVVPNSARVVPNSVALVIAILALAAYVRTLAPDILYGDSAEFQCLAYTLGITHSTGYPTYLLLGRLVGYLPVNNLAWRISLLSAICAAVSVGGVYLLALHFTRSRLGAALGSLSLGVSYTFWSQAVIAEVYTPAMAFLTVILLLLFHWHADHKKHNASLLAAALLAGFGFGVHASVWLIALPAAAFVLWQLRRQNASRSEWIRSLSAGGAGAFTGLAIFLAAFFIFDQINSPASFINTTLQPSRVFWDLPAEDFSSPLERLKMTVFSAQWGGALFPGGKFSFFNEAVHFFERLAKLEFSPPLILFALAGLVIMLLTRRPEGIFYCAYFLFAFLFIMNYQVSDKYVFYLSLYIPLAVAAGVGIGAALDWIHRLLQSMPGRAARLIYVLPVLFFVTLVLQPSASARWQALRSGVAGFVEEDYVFPVQNLAEPRYVAQMYLTGVPDNAVFVMDWRALYSTAYLAHVERGLTNMLFFEAMPAGNNGKVASTLVDQLSSYLQEGRPVYVERKYPGLESSFRYQPALGNLYKIVELHPTPP